LIAISRVVHDLKKLWCIKRLGKNNFFEDFQVSRNFQREGDDVILTLQGFF